MPSSQMLTCILCVIAFVLRLKQNNQSDPSLVSTPDRTSNMQILRLEKNPHLVCPAHRRPLKERRSPASQNFTRWHLPLTSHHSLLSYLCWLVREPYGECMARESKRHTLRVCPDETTYLFLSIMIGVRTLRVVLSFDFLP